MKKSALLLTLLLTWQTTVQAANLLEVYQQAQISDPIFQQAIAQRLATKEGVPINLAALLPNLSLTANPAVSRTGYAGSQYTPVSNQTSGFVSPRNLTQRTYMLDLALSQTVFDYTQFAAYGGAIATSKQADATLNAALQNLMIRVAAAYFAVLQDEENLNYARASKLAYAKQLDQITQQYHVGLKTITDAYTARASYDSSVATYIGAETTLANDRENLRAITGVYYPHLAKLRKDFPLVNPQPDNMEKWVNTSLQQNWQIKASQYGVDAARRNIDQQFGGHLPTIALAGSFSRQYMENINRYQTFNVRNGPGTISERSIGFNIAVPLIAGGQVVAQTQQATYNYQLAQQQLEQTVRTTTTTARQSFLNVIAGISKVKADQQTIKSTMSSLDGLEERYHVGTETLVNVLQQRQNVFLAQTNYATDRYAFINNLLALKQAAGTLSFNDLRALNWWLTVDG